MSEVLRFDGKVAFVTGGGSGMGRAYCNFLAQRGAKVVVNDFHPSGKGSEQQAVEEILAGGGDAFGVNGSVTEKSDVERMIGEAIDHYGRLDILINNAGTSDNSMDVVGGPDERLYKQLEIHTIAPMRTAAAAWKHLQKSGAGRIVNIASSSAYGVEVDGVWEGAYGPAKAAVFTVTRQMAGAGEPHGIKANSVVPWAWTPMVAGNCEGTEFGDWMKEHMPAELVAAVVGYLVHPDCTINGQAFTAAGGHVTRVFFAATKGYFNPHLTPEDLKANIGKVLGDHDGNDFYSNVLDLKSVGREFDEHDRVFKCGIENVTGRAG